MNFGLVCCSSAVSSSLWQKRAGLTCSVRATHPYQPVKYIWPAAHFQQPQYLPENIQADRQQRKHLVCFFWLVFTWYTVTKEEDIPFLGNRERTLNARIWCELHNSADSQIFSSKYFAANIFFGKDYILHPSNLCKLQFQYFDHIYLFIY